MYENPGEYEIKILENGKLARTAKFTMSPKYQLVDTDIGAKNNLATGRIVVPVQIIGDQDGQWDHDVLIQPVDVDEIRLHQYRALVYLWSQ